MKKVIGIDLGGTNIKGIVMDDSGTILCQHQVKTKEDKDGKWRENILDLVKYLNKEIGTPIESVGLSAPGLANADNTAIDFLPNRLLGLEGFVWGDFFKQPTYVLNDAHAALMAEHQFGVLKNFNNAILITLGTGVGGGILINGELYQGQAQMAGHIGHMSVNTEDDETSLFGVPGSLEYQIGNFSVSKRSHGVFKTTQELLEAYEKGDFWAKHLWLNSVKKLAIACVSLSNLLSPQAFAFSGGITKANDLLLDPLNQFFDLFEFRENGKKTPLFLSKFQEMSGAVGAAAFALKKSIK